ncbi:MAG TPA: TfuA-like protein [Nitrososphaeraceae archaeon]|nr:TfuA-like protein [Nitrososphaeraceae archaeon]
MSIPIVFLGPSLSIEKARKIINAEFLPPAKKGDFIKLSLISEKKIIILIDGVFLQDYPPTPIEVFQVVNKNNFQVYGASSLGALRAVELEKFGMKGYGQVFELFKKNIINSDDEVAVTFDNSYNLLSEAMIDIRYNLFLAFKKGIIDKETKQLITRTAKKIYFPFRSYENIVKKSIELYSDTRDTIEDFHNFVSTQRQSLKELDAMGILKKIAENPQY